LLFSGHNLLITNTRKPIKDSADFYLVSFLTLWHPAAFGDFRKKTPKHTWLCVGISLLLYGLRTWSKRQKTRQVL